MNAEETFDEFQKLMGIPEKYELEANKSYLQRYLSFKILLKDFEIKKHRLQVYPIFHKKYELNIANVMKHKGQDDYISYGPTFISRDGEYKPVLTTMNNLNDIFGKNKEYKDFIYNFLEKEEEHLKTDLSDKEIYLALAASFSYYKILLKETTLPNNISDNYRKLFGKYMKKFYMEGNHFALKVLDASQKNKLKALGNSQLGMKILTLNINDVRNLGSIRRSSFREVYISQKIQEIVYQMISPFFPTVVEWAFFNIDSLYVFSNKITFQKFEKSGRFVELVKHLYQAKQVPEEDCNVEVIEHYLQTVEIPIKYAEKELVLTVKCFVIISEHVGKTLADMCNLYTELKNKTIVLSKKAEEIYNILNIFKSVDNFKNIFAYYFYNLHVLSKRLGMIHTDLHLNNVTYKIRRIRGIDVFVVGKKEYHIFSGFVGYIIDFGRMIMHSDTIRKEFEYDLDLIDEQNKKLIKYFCKSLPEFSKSIITKVTAGFQTNFPSIYKVFYALDPLNLLNNFKSYATKLLSFELADVVVDMIVFIENYIRKWLPKALDGDHVDKIPYIGEEIFKEFYTPGELKDNKSTFSGYYDSDKETSESDFFQKDIILDEKYYEKIKKEILEDYEKKLKY